MHKRMHPKDVRERKNDALNDAHTPYGIHFKTSIFLVLGWPISLPKHFYAKSHIIIFTQSTKELENQI